MTETAATSEPGEGGRRHRVSAALVIAAAVLTIAACGSSPSRPSTDASGLPLHRPVRLSDLAGRPQARLYFPGSALEKRIGSDQTARPHADEPDPAYAASVLTAATSADQLLAWYGRTLAAEGFTPARYFLPANQSTGAAWAFHHRLQVQVGVIRSPTSPTSTGGRLTYEVYLVGYPPGLPKY